MKITRRCACGNPATVHDYDEPAVCEDCVEEDDRDIRSAEAWRNQAGAQWLAYDRGQRDWVP